ncbi:MAG: sulfotransferase family protein [Gammaproteobacteria bacterium]|nr:MAG: sulfotransferase family protein [Gammaproteobacteria bacterium]
MHDSASDDSSRHISDELAAIRQHMVDGDFAAAASRLEETVAASPESTEAFYLLAVCQRYLDQYEAAIASLEQLKRLAPEHSRAYQEEGHLNGDMGRSEAALEAYRRAYTLNPALEASYRGQITILESLGRHAAAERVHDQLDWLLELPKPLVAVTDLLAQNKLAKAEALCRRFMQKNPRNIEGMRLLASIGLRLGVLEDAEFLLESAVAFAPEHIPARIDYVQALRKRQKFARALEEARILLDKSPDNPQFRSLYAIESMQTGDYDTALAAFDEVLEQLPGDPATLTSKGHALKTCGRTDEAVTAYRSALLRHPRHGEAYYALANLKTYRFTGDEIARMHEQEHNADLGHMERVYLNFALGKAYEDQDDYATSFGYYAEGNQLKRAQSRYDADRMTEEFEAQKAICTQELFEQHAGSGDPATDPIFIVGLPRAGSTLLEQILSSHSQVDGTLELPNILSLSQQLRRRPSAGAGDSYPAILAELEGEELAAFGRRFIEDTRIHRQGAPRFIDKMPNNFRHIGLIHLILPNARIIDARRHPMACCFSGFKQLFAEGQEFSYSLTDIGRYYRDYVALMDHWDSVLPGRVLRVMHEEVVADLEGQVRRILHFCGLPFEDACLRYYETERNVRTPSSEQVRKPIFRESLEQWRCYEDFLEPLKDALGQDVLKRCS